MKRYRILVAAQRELEANLERLRDENPAAARERLAAIVDAVRRLAEGGLDGSEVTLRDGRRLRHWVVWPLVIYYRRDPTEMVVLRVRDGRRRPITRQRKR